LAHRESPPKPAGSEREKPVSSWQAAELMRFLKENAGNPDLNSRTVFLSNPEEKSRVDRIIQNELWPGVIRALAGSPIRVLESEEGFPLSAIQDQKAIHTTRSLTFVLSDQERPMYPGESPPWFCRGKIECSLHDYMFSFDFFAYFPMDFDLGKILELLSDPLFSGNPPNLTIEPRMDNSQIMVVSFREGEGAGWGLRDFQTAGAVLEQKVVKNLEVIRTLYRLERDYTNEKRFLDLQKALREAYQAY
jgi:hypothetical protein